MNAFVLPTLKQSSKTSMIGFLMVLLSFSPSLWAQAENNAAQGLNLGTLTGNLQSDFRYYRRDSLISAEQPPEKIGSNNYLLLNYQRGNFRAGVRYEGYFPPLLGYPNNLRGNGIAHRFAGYSVGGLDVTAGHFYEQFGNGLVLRLQEDRFIGIDNAIDGLRVKYNFNDAVYLTGLVGKIRNGFLGLSGGTVRAVNADVYVSNFFPAPESGTRNLNLSVGGSYVSKYEPYLGTRAYVAENVAAYSGRAALKFFNFSVDMEAAYKESDPSRLNNYISKSGSAFLLNMNYSTKGLGLAFSAKRIDNMDFRAERTAIDNVMFINFVPANTRQHTYRLLTLYPYAAQQVAGEWGFQGEMVYTLPKNTFLGGKYGTTLTLNYATARNLTTRALPDERGYEAEPFLIGEKVYYQDFNIEINRRWNKKLRTIFMFAKLDYDKDQIEGRTGYGLVKSMTIIGEVQYKINKQTALRVELQHMSTEQDFGNWAYALAELTFAPHFSFYVADEYNYVSSDYSGTRKHYYDFGAAYVKGGNRFAISYGRQRAGLLCVGGICRIVPASSGFSLSINSTF